MDYADGGDMYSKIAKQKKTGKGFSYVFSTIKYKHHLIQRVTNTRLVRSDFFGFEICA